MKYFKYILLFLFVASSTMGFSQTRKRHHANVVKTSEAEVVDTVKTTKAKKKTDETEQSAKTVRLGSRYLFGVATSYADSVTMVTNICQVDGMEGRLQEKSPIGLDLYTQSLKEYLQNSGKKGYVCATFVCKTKKEAEQKLVSVRNNVLRKKSTALVPMGDFKYTYISTEHIYSNESKESEESDDDF